MERSLKQRIRMHYRFKKAQFIKSAVWDREFPPGKQGQGQIWPEIAVVGRSNVGKSTLLNDLFQEKNLVKTSSVPGKTQLINFFSLDEELLFADLPGYGYAKAPLAVKKRWGPMIENYLQKRENLKLLLFLLDIRRHPSPEDKEMLELAIKYQKAVIFVLTKVDKVSNGEKARNTQAILKEFGAANLHYVHYSVVERIGRKQLIAMMTEALLDELSERIP